MCTDSFKKNAYHVFHNQSNWKKSNSQQEEIGFLKNMMYLFIQCYIV